MVQSAADAPDTTRERLVVVLPPAVLAEFLIVQKSCLYMLYVVSMVQLKAALLTRHTELTEVSVWRVIQLDAEPELESQL